MTTTNLVALASEIAQREGLQRGAGGTPQVLEILGLLGARWRRLSQHEMLREVACIVERGGVRSAHEQEGVNSE